MDKRTNQLAHFKFTDSESKIQRMIFIDLSSFAYTSLPSLILPLSPKVMFVLSLGTVGKRNKNLWEFFDLYFSSLHDSFQMRSVR